MAVNAAWTEVTFTPDGAGAIGTGVWKHLDQIRTPYSQAQSVRLDDVPPIVLQVAESGNLAKKGIRNIEATALGVTVTSSHVDDEAVLKFVGIVQVPQSFFGIGAL